MTNYNSEIQRIKGLIYTNEHQIGTAIRVRHALAKDCGEEISLQKLCESQFISKYHLIRVFRKYYGQTPFQFLTDKRMEMAKLLLASGRSVSETCYAVGIKSPCSFSTLFRRRMGMTPTMFQKSNFRKVDSAKGLEI